jgi:AcrR family transcriptional regulator
MATLKSKPTKPSTAKPVATKRRAGRVLSSGNEEAKGLVTGARRSPGRARNDSSRIAILNATLKLLETTPLQHVSIESIAREAGVGKATIYRWWTSKAAVVIDAFAQKHIAHTPMPKGVSAREALTRQLHLLIEQYGGWSGHILAQIVAEGQADPDVLREVRERFFYGRRAMAREVFEEGRRNGELRTDMEIEMQMDILVAPIYLRLFMGHLPLDRAFADQHCSLMMDLLSAKAQGVAPVAKRSKAR